MTFQNENERERRRKPEDESAEPGQQARPARKRKPATNVGNTLRSVYQTTVNEDVPPEMLDLLGKLS